MEAFVQVTQSDGSTERFPIEGSQTTLGRSGKAGVSLPGNAQLELEHLLLVPRGAEGCWVSVNQDAKVPVKIGSKVFTDSVVKWGTELSIGELKLRLTNKREVVKTGGTSPIVVVGGLLILVVVGWMLFRQQQHAPPSSEGLEPPALFGGPVACPTAGTPAGNARIAERNADSWGDRYAYDPQDGVNAVHGYREAAACYTAAGAAEDAQRMEREAGKMRDTINQDYAGRRLALGRAIDARDYQAALRHCSALLALTEHLPREDAYIRWLERTRRFVKARLIQEEQSHR